MRSSFGRNLKAMKRLKSTQLRAAARDRARGRERRSKPKGLMANVRQAQARKATAVCAFDFF